MRPWTKAPLPFARSLRDYGCLQVYRSRRSYIVATRYSRRIAGVGSSGSYGGYFNRNTIIGEAFDSKTLCGIVSTIRTTHSKRSIVLDDKAFMPLIKHGYNGLEKLRIPQDQDVSNQDMNVQKGHLQQLIPNFNNPNINTSIGYGSGVFEQEGYNSKTMPQVDLIHVVGDTQKFHAKNLETFHHHYSGLRYGGVRLVEYFQNLGLVKIYFNPYVNMNGTMIKYGVISETQMIQDLIEWKSLYLAGRLQKPVKFFSNLGIQSTDQTHLLKVINSFNLRNAVKISLLISKSKIIPEKTLYEIITLISYLGDSRMIIGGENPNKIKNIVNKQLENFQKLYRPVLDQLETEQLINRKEGNIVITQLNPMKMKESLLSLPKYYREQVIELYRDHQTLKGLNRSRGLNGNSNSANWDMESLARESDVVLREIIIKALKKIVLSPSIFVSLKGLVTAGIFKSVRYMIDKRLKYHQR